MSTKSVVLLVVVTMGMACGHRTAERREDRREDRREHPAASRGDWKKLGERWVDGARDRDVIAVGAGDGTFRRIMIVVEHSSLEMHDLVVNFGDGTNFSPPTRLVFGANSRSQIIDLPGAQRVIRSVDFRYGNLPGGGKAQAELWAQ